MEIILAVLSGEVAIHSHFSVAPIYASKLTVYFQNFSNLPLNIDNSEK